MNKVPFVYIVILNFNSYEDTIECINSIKKVTYPNYKIVVVDNDSKDNSVKVLRDKYPELSILVSNENLGYASGNNIGIKYALEENAEYICVLNNDVVVEKNFLEPLIKIFEVDNKIGMVGPCICEYSNRDKVQAMGAYINLYRGLAMGQCEGADYSSIKNKLFDVDYLGGACFIVKAEVFKNIGLIPENYFLFYEETEFCLNAKRKGYNLICVYDSKVYHKRSATISKYTGLSYFFLNRNRIVFMRRNANFIKKLIFFFYIIAETIGRIIIRREPFKLVKYYINGLKADINNIDLDGIKHYM